MLHIPKHLLRSHVQWPGPSLGIRIGIFGRRREDLSLVLLVGGPTLHAQAKGH